MNRLQRRAQTYSDFTTQNYSSFMTSLITIWRNEKLCQTLLPYEENIINEVIAQIEKKEEEIKNKKMDKNMKYYNIIACIPQLSDLDPLAEVSPFIIVLVFNLIKEAIEDYRKYKNDKKANETSVLIFKDKRFTREK